MNEHEAVESLSAYLDREVGGTELARIESHLATCRRCADLKASLEGAVLAVAALPDVAPTPDESRAIRLRVLEEAGPARSRRPWEARLWAAAGAVALLGAGIVGYALLRNAPQHAATDSAAPAAGSEAGAPLAFASGEEVRDAVSALPEVREGTGRYRVADVGARQPEAVSRFSSQAPAAAPAAKSEDSSGQARGAAGAERPVADCIREVLHTQPYPMIPLVARPATFQGRDAWLIVFAWTPSSEPDDALDRIQVWLVARTDCSVVHYSFFTP